MWLQVEGVRGVICFPLRAGINPYIFCSSHICFPVFPLTNGTLILTDCRSHWWCILASRHPGILASWWMRPCDDGNCQQLQFSCVCQTQMTIGWRKIHGARGILEFLVTTCSKPIKASKWSPLHWHFNEAPKSKWVPKPKGQRKDVLKMNNARRQRMTETEYVINCAKKRATELRK